MAKKVKSLIHPALHVYMRTGPTDHFPSQPITGSDYTMGVRLLRSSLTPTRVQGVIWSRGPGASPPGHARLG